MTKATTHTAQTNDSPNWPYKIAYAVFGSFMQGIYYNYDCQPQKTKVRLPVFDYSYDASNVTYDNNDYFCGIMTTIRGVNIDDNISYNQVIVDGYETGFDCFGARYYSSVPIAIGMRVWLSVDPLADKYPSMSPFMYTAGNPVMLVDPDGRDHWKIGDDGKATLQDTKGKHIYVNGKKLSKHDFAGHEEAASTIATHYYNKHFSKNKYHLANGEISIASFKDGKFDRKSSYNIDENYTPGETSYATSMSGKGNSDRKNRINLFLVDGHMDPEFDNKYNLINCLSHERVHLIQGATSPSIRNELQAYYKMMTHWSWNKTDGRFKSDMEGNVNDYITSLWEWGYFRGGITQAKKKYSQRLYHYYVKLFSPLMNVRKPN